MLEDTVGDVGVVLVTVVRMVHLHNGQTFSKIFREATQLMFQQVLRKEHVSVTSRPFRKL